jgi:hypothetical protein
VVAESGQHSILTGVTHQVGPGTGLTAGKLPPLARVVTAIPRDTGLRLLTARQPRQEPGPGEISLLVIGQEGRGRVVWFGGLYLWRQAFWEPALGQATTAEQPARRLLRNLLVWTAAGEEEAGLTLVGHRTVYQEGERIRLEAQWRDMRGAPVMDRPMVLRLQPLAADAEIEVRTYSMAPLPGVPGQAAVTLPPLPPGRYRVQPLAAGAAQSEGREAVLVVTPHSLEATQVRQDSRYLRQLAGRGGGAYLAGESAEAANRLAQVVADWNLAGDTQVLRQQWEIWSGWPWLILVVLLLGGEWAVRRRQGLL